MNSVWFLIFPEMFAWTQLEGSGSWTCELLYVLDSPHFLPLLLLLSLADVKCIVGYLAFPSTTQVTSGAYSIEQAEQVPIWALGADLAVLGTRAESRSPQQLLGVDGSPVLGQGALLVAVQPSGSAGTGSYHLEQLDSQPPILMSFFNPHLVSLATGRRRGMSFLLFLSLPVV